MALPPPLKLPEFLSIVPAIADSCGNVIGAPHAIFTGPSSIIEDRLRDGRKVKEALAIINDAEHARGTLQSIREREAAVAAREDAVEDSVKRKLLGDIIGKLAKLTARLDSFEQERTHDPDDDLLPPVPGSVVGPSGAGEPADDDGDLQASHPPSRDKYAERNDVPLSYGNVPTSYVHSDLKNAPTTPEDPDNPEGTDPDMPRPPVAVENY